MGIINYGGKRRLLIKAQRGKCFYCMEPLKVSNCELDHIIPRSANGGNKIMNLVASCSECNRAKGSLDADEFLDLAHRSTFEYVKSLKHLRDKKLMRKWCAKDSS